MICLGIDTTGDWCSAALVDHARIIGMERQNIKRGHAEILAPMVQRLMKSASISPKDISKISVCTGPGSFTGLRVGLSFAKGFALPRATPIAGISALEVWARTVDPKACHTVFSVADVRRQQLLWQVFKNGLALTKPNLTNIETAKAAAKPCAVLTGNGAQLLGGAAQDTYVCPARLAWMGLDANAADYPANPLYHRPPDAKLPGGKTL